MKKLSHGLVIEGRHHIVKRLLIMGILWKLIRIHTPLFHEVLLRDQNKLSRWNFFYIFIFYVCTVSNPLVAAAGSLLK